MKKNEKLETRGIRLFLYCFRLQSQTTIVWSLEVLDARWISKANQCTQYVYQVQTTSLHHSLRHRHSISLWPMRTTLLMTWNSQGIKWMKAQCMALILGCYPQLTKMPTQSSLWRSLSSTRMEAGLLFSATAHFTKPIVLITKRPSHIAFK